MYSSLPSQLSKNKHNIFSELQPMAEHGPGSAGETGDDSVWWINAALLPEGLSGEEVKQPFFPDQRNGGFHGDSPVAGWFMMGISVTMDDLGI